MDAPALYLGRLEMSKNIFLTTQGGIVTKCPIGHMSHAKTETQPDQSLSLILYEA